MSGYELDFCMLLREKLRERVYAGIKTEVMDDVLIITLYRRTENTFDYRIWDFSNKLIHGLTINEVMDEVLGFYKKWLLKGYFKPIQNNNEPYVLF